VPRAPKTGPRAAHEKRLRELVRVPKMEQDRYDVPVYVGEFDSVEHSPDGVKAMGLYYTTFTERGLHWLP